MPKSPAFVSPGFIALDPSDSLPLYRQLYNALREAILSGQLKPGSRLPSTRLFAADLAVSRNTVVNAFEQLIAEGYLEGQVGAGTHVTTDLPDDILNIRPHAPPATVNEPPSDRQPLSARGALIAQTSVSQNRHSDSVCPFRAGLPALAELPLPIWARLLARRLRAPADELLVYGQPAGYRPLREAVAAYLGTARGVRCEAEQVIIVAGAQQALDLTARLLLDPGEMVWVENPGYLGARGALLAAGARPVPVPVDQDGLVVERGMTLAPEARLVYISPSHQYPLGVTMSLARRLALLRWADQARAWLVEDDYDSEYRYAGPPLATVQSLDQKGRVIYIGTFSKVLFPALRLGYLVVPPDLVQAFVAAKALVDRAAPSLEQAVLADFIAEGHFARHIRRMRLLYAARQAVLIEAAAQELPGLLEVQPTFAGLHLVGWLPEGVDDRLVSQALAVAGIEAVSVSSFAMTPLARGGLVLGYAAVSETQIRQGVKKMAGVLRGLIK